MMQRKIYFLLAMLFVIVVQLTYANDQKGSSALNRNSYVDDAEKNQDEEKEDSPKKRPSTRRNSHSILTHYLKKLGQQSSNDGSESTDSSSPITGPPLFIPGALTPANFWNHAGALNSNGPQCYALMDPLYPQFSDICGTLPQVRYSLPNAFGHAQRWQIAQALSTMLSAPMPSTSNPVCYRSLRLLVCPLLFPPCPTPVEPVPVIPCKPFCQAVKSQCAATSLDLLPCDYLPLTSDLCPVNPTPYSALLASYGQKMVLPQTELSSILAQSALSMALSQQNAQQQQQQGAQQPQNQPNAGAAIPTQIPYQLSFPSQVPQAAFPGSIPPQFFFQSTMSPQSFFPSAMPQQSLFPSAVPQQSLFPSTMTPQSFFPSITPPANIPEVARSFVTQVGFQQQQPQYQQPQYQQPQYQQQQQQQQQQQATNTLNPVLVNYPPIPSGQNTQAAGR